jgi:cytolysin-activating lysine-acyltransferase
MASKQKNSQAPKSAAKPEAKPTEVTPAPATDADLSPEAAAARDREFLRVLGEVSWLMSLSAPHRHLFMADLEWLVLPPMALTQARLYRNDKGSPIAYASWALVSDEVDARLKQRIGKLKPADWRSGPHPWIIDLVAPFGGVQEVLSTLQNTVFAGKSVLVLPLGGKPLPAAEKQPATA